MFSRLRISTSFLAFSNEYAVNKATGFVDWEEWSRLVPLGLSPKRRIEFTGLTSSECHLTHEAHECEVEQSRVLVTVQPQKGVTEFSCEVFLRMIPQLPPTQLRSLIPSTPCRIPKASLLISTSPESGTYPPYSPLQNVLTFYSALPPTGWSPLRTTPLSKLILPMWTTLALTTNKSLAMRCVDTSGIRVDLMRPWTVWRREMDSLLTFLNSKLHKAGSLYPFTTTTCYQLYFAFLIKWFFQLLRELRFFMFVRFSLFVDLCWPGKEFPAI